MSCKDRYALQLGMNVSTAGHRLVKDLLFESVKKKPCCRCGKLMQRENFSIEHFTPWRNAENALELFFDLENVTFSHHKCNMDHVRKAKANPVDQRRRKTAKAKAAYNPEKRKEKYRVSGH